MAEVAKERWPVLIAIFCFDIVTYTFRLGARAILGGPGGLLAMLVSLLPQLTNMVALYGAIHFINRRSRCTVRAGYQARACTACNPQIRPGTSTLSDCLNARLPLQRVSQLPGAPLELLGIWCFAQTGPRACL